MNWIALGWRRYLDFRGRSRRQEFWTWVLFTWLGATALAMVDRSFGLTSDANPLAMEGGLLSGLFSLATFVPSLAVSVRRLHDTDRRWWWLLLPLAAVVLVAVLIFATVGVGAPIGLLFIALFLGSLFALLVLFCLEGTRGANRFGPNPKDPASAADLAEVFR